MSTLPTLICHAHPEWVALHDASWRIAASNVENPSAPGWKQQMCCMPGTGIIWLWDSCFMPFFARYGGGHVPVMNNLDNLYSMQRADGFIAMAYKIEPQTLAYGERINPPLLAWTELNYWRFRGDDSRLKEVLPRLVRYFDWIKANRRRKSGLYWFEDSGSTGMDNSPRSGYAAEYLNGSDVCHVDLAGQQALAAECIATMARHLGDEKLAARFEGEHTEIVRLLNVFHWHPKSGFYYDVFNRDDPGDRHNVLNHKTVAAFWPLMAGCCNAEQVEAVIGHLLNTEEFWTKHPVPSLSKDDPNFDPAGAYWLGGVWPPINYMLTKALQRQGRPDLAHRLAEAHLKAMSEVFQSSDYPGIWEAYAPESFHPATNKPVIDFENQAPVELGANTVVKPNFVGWSGLGPIAMLIEDIFGLDFDSPRRRITWNLQTSGRHGIENLNFDNDVVTLISEGYSEAAPNTKITITTGKPVTLVLLLNGALAHEASYHQGTHTIELKHNSSKTQ